MSRSLLTVLLALLASCGLAKGDLHPVLKHVVNTVEIAEVEGDGILVIRQVNPVFLVMGSSGMVLDAVLISKNHERYEERAGAVYQQCMNTFRDTLAREIGGMGYAVHAGDVKYWDYFKPSQKGLRDHADAILRIRFKQLGFFSMGLRSDFIPSAYVFAELIQPETREVLYSDRFTVGLDESIVKIAALAEGEIRPLLVPGADVAYADLKDVLDHPQQSRMALLSIAEAAARHVAEGMQGRRAPTLMVYQPELNSHLSSLPSFDAMRQEMKP
ncbi:hypothetical protein [Mariprofundus erugo]|uniref:hypothetical protein n=1 Tax=Mariprofundus erugo TaxID=2528639 RepID=UPI001EE7CC10|nr:hypothetical protein [Mariprofundus erugo]